VKTRGPSAVTTAHGMRRVIAALCSFAALLATVPAMASPPGYCRRLGYSPQRRGGGDVLITGLGATDGATFDGSHPVVGPLLLLGVPAGTHRVVITPEGHGDAIQTVVVVAGRSAVVRPAPRGGTASRQPGRSHRLFVAGAAQLSTPRVTGTSADRPRLSPVRIRADDLARFHCDPVLDPHLPPVQALLAETEAACARDEGWACALAAEQWFGEVGVRRRDPAQAVARLEHACRLGVGDACEEFARMLAIGNGVAKDPERAAAVLEATCRDGAGHAKSCAARAWALLPDTPTHEDRARAAPFLHRACAIDPGFCSAARELQLRSSCGHGDHGACELLLPDDSVRVARESEGAVDSTAPR
jgi:hypothetical protein